MFEWFKILYKRIQSSDNDYFIKRINMLEAKVTKLLSLYSQCHAIKIKLMDAVQSKNYEINRLHVKLQAQRCDKIRQKLQKYLLLDAHASLQSYKRWLDKNVKPTPRYYNFGYGKKRVHTIFADSIKDEDIIREFITKDLKFDASIYDNPDDLVYFFSTWFSRMYPTLAYYRTDETLYRTIEYWATAKETILQIRNNEVIGDCDDYMTLKYSCLYYLLKDRFPNELWRLRGFIVDLWTGGGHALLGWVKGGDVNDWIPIETTFYDDREFKIWDNNYTIRNQLLYQIRYSFDDKNEYVKI